MNTVEAVSYLLETNLNFRVEVGLNEAKQILAKLEKYNEMPDDLEKIVDRIKSMIGPIDFGKENPNNGLWNNIKISIGNESSLVIYVDVNCFYRVGSDPKKIKADLESIGRAFSADENNVEIKLPEPFMNQKMIHVRARYWWD